MFIDTTGKHQCATQIMPGMFTVHLNAKQVAALCADDERGFVDVYSYIDDTKHRLWGRVEIVLHCKQHLTVTL